MRKSEKEFEQSEPSYAQIESFLDGVIDFSETLSRAKFDDLNMDLFKTTMDIVKTTLEDGKVKISEVDEIVLVGGSTRIVKVREMLKELFNGKEPNNGVNPDEAVAFGAAVLAAKLSGQPHHSAQYGNVTLIDVIPLSLGMEVIGGLNCIIIPKNTVIPVKRSGTFYTVKDWQTRVFNKVVQGDRPLTKDCIELGRFYLDGITPALRGVTIIDRTLEVDVNGILTVTAKERRPGAEPKSLTIIDYKGFLTQAEIERMTREAKMMSEEDAIAKERVKAMNDLEKYIYDVKTIIGNSEIGNMMSSDDRTMLESAIQEDSLWLDVNKHSTKEVYDEKKKELGDLLNSIVTKVHNNS
ncbi:Luminal-binding protein [Linum grandiflorum]